MRHWNVAGALVKPKDMTQTKNDHEVFILRCSRMAANVAACATEVGK
jgi:hypothetical protein